MFKQLLPIICVHMRMLDVGWITYRDNGEVCICYYGWTMEPRLACLLFGFFLPSFMHMR